MNLELRVVWCGVSVCFGTVGTFEHAVQRQAVANSGKLWVFVIADFDYLLQFFFFVL